MISRLSIKRKCFNLIPGRRSRGQNLLIFKVDFILECYCFPVYEVFLSSEAISSSHVDSCTYINTKCQQWELAVNPDSPETYWSCGDPACRYARLNICASHK